MLTLHRSEPKPLPYDWVTLWVKQSRRQSTASDAQLRKPARGLDRS